MNEKKVYINIPIILALVVAFIGLFVGSFLDLDIAKEVGDPNNGLSVALSVIGPIPPLTIGIFSAGILIFGPARKHKKVSIFMRVFGILAAGFITFFEFLSTKVYAEAAPFNAHQTLFELLLLGLLILINALVLFFVWKYGKKLDQEKAFLVAVLSISIVILVAGATEVFKYLASRPRPGVVLSGEEEFRAWYQWKPFVAFGAEECKSLPSGHSSCTADLMTLLPLFISLFPISKKKYSGLIAFLVGALFCLVTAASRLLGQEHFLSDISCGIIGSLIVQIVVLVAVPAIYNKVESKK